MSCFEVQVAWMHNQGMRKAVQSNRVFFLQMAMFPECTI